MSIIFLTYAIYRRILRAERKQISYGEVDIIPRPRKCRKVCQLPRIQEFHPLGPPPCGPAVVLNVDEYEAIRLIDRQGFSQEECSAYMQVARTTVQMIYNSARKKAGGGAGGRSPAPDRGRLLPALRRKRRSLRLRRMQKASAGLQPENSYGGGSS